MTTGRFRRRGVMLALVLMVMGLVGGLLVLLASANAHRYRHRQAERVRLVSRAVADSAADYARTQLATWSTNPPAEPIELDVAALLPRKMTGSATMTVLTSDGQTVCHIATRVTRGICTIATRSDVRLD
ncbi:MAG: hypothetical protein JXO22_13910 [Phycisphaerae bacterium]|nr:hypothetical protein [Phycisphaerae bacterium]